MAARAFGYLQELFIYLCSHLWSMVICPVENVTWRVYWRACLAGQVTQPARLASQVAQRACLPGQVVAQPADLVAEPARRFER